VEAKEPPEKKQKCKRKASSVVDVLGDSNGAEWTFLLAALTQQGYPLRAVQLVGDFLDFWATSWTSFPSCTVCGQMPFCPVRCTACDQVSCQPCIEKGSELADGAWVVPCCGGRTHVYDYDFSLAWLLQSPQGPEPSTYRITYQGMDIKYFSLAPRKTRASQGTPSVAYVHLQDSGEVLITLTQFSDANLREVGLTVFDAGQWRKGGDGLRLTLLHLISSGNSGFCTKDVELPSEFLLHDASITSGAVFQSVSKADEDGGWSPCGDLKLLPTGNALAQNKFEVVKCLRWLHGTSDMILCLCADKKVVTVKEHELETADGEVITFRSTCQPHGWWFEFGALLVVTFNHQGVEKSVSSHALFFDTSPCTYKGLITWRHGKVCLHAGEVEARPTCLPKAPCFTKSHLWREAPVFIPSVDEIELPTPVHCKRALRSLNPTSATLIFNDYVHFLVKLMATDGLDSTPHVQLAKEFMRIINLSSHFCTGAQPPSIDQIQGSWHVRHKKQLRVVAYSLAGNEICSHSVEDVIGASAAFTQLTDVLQPWEETLVQIELSSTHKEDGEVAQYGFHAVRLNYNGLSLDDARARLTSWDLGNRYLPSQLGMALNGTSTSARHQLCQEYFAQLQRDLENSARAPLCGSHYIILLDVSSSMCASFLQCYCEEAAEFEQLGLTKGILRHGTNLAIVEHILDAFFVPQLLQNNICVGNAKFSNKLIRVETPSDNPTPFSLDSHRDGGGTEIYNSLMSVAAHLTLPVLDMTGDAGVILITDGEQHHTGIDVNELSRLFNRNFRLEVIGIRAQLAGPLKQLIRGSFSVPYQIGNLKNLMTALTETLNRIKLRATMSPESRNDIRQPVELYHPNMWYLLDED